MSVLSEAIVMVVLGGAIGLVLLCAVALVADMLGGLRAELRFRRTVGRNLPSGADVRIFSRHRPYPRGRY